MILKLRQRAVDEWEVCEGMKLVSEAEQFFDAVDPASGGKSEVTFNYLAVLHGDQYLLISSRLWFIHRTSVPFTHFKSGSGRVIAGQYRLTELNCSPREVVGQITRGSVSTPRGTLHFPVDQLNNTSRTFHSHHEAGLVSQSRINVLNITTDGPHLDRVALDWDVKAAAVPFDNIYELVSHYAAGEYLADRCTFEAVAQAVAFVDKESTVQGTTANLRIQLVEGLPTDRASMGYRVLVNRVIMERSSISGSDFEWSLNEGVQTGRKSIEVPPAAVVQCIACFAGMAQNTYWIADSSNFQNPLRAAYEEFDPNLTVLRDFLQISGGTARNKAQAADFDLCTCNTAKAILL